MKIFLDTDLNFPSDYFQALLLLLADVNAEIVGCGASSGNTWSEEVFSNLNVAVKMLGETRIPVYSGASYTQFSSRHDLANNAKTRGIRNFIGAYEKFSKPRSWIAGDEDCQAGMTLTASAIIALSHEYRSDLSIICIGPLTNLATALEMDPDLPQRLNTVTVMGGCFSRSADAANIIDFNFWFDPQSAQKVLNSGLDVRLVPLDVCQSARLNGDLLERIAQYDQGRAALFVDDLLGMVRQHGPALPLSDHLAVLLHTDANLILHESPAHVQVDVSDDDTRGSTILIEDLDANVRVVRVIDVESVFETILSRVQRMNDQYCRPFRPFESPSFQYHIGQRLERRPLTILNAIFEREYQLEAPIEIQSSAQFANIINPLADLLIRAKERAELWPPAPRADAQIERMSSSSVIQFDQLALKELEFLICERFLNVRAIATIARPGEPPKGFTCISELPPHRLQFMQSQFGMGIDPQSVLAEYSYIERRIFGLRALDYLGCQLLLWISTIRASDGDSIRILAVSLETQMASRHKLWIGGFSEVAEHTIPDGPEKGRKLILYSRTMTIDDLRRSMDAERSIQGQLTT